jgi:hypothetical protein
MDQVAVKAGDDGMHSVAQPAGASGDCVEYGLDVGGRARDDPEDFAGRHLLIQRLGHLGVGMRERSVLFLEFGEQPHIFNGNDRLVGERCE